MSVASPDARDIDPLRANLSERVRNRESYYMVFFQYSLGVLKFAINAGINSLAAADNLKRGGKRTSDGCDFCENVQPQGSKY